MTYPRAATLARHRGLALAVLMAISACSPLGTAADPAASSGMETVILLTGDLEPVGCPAALIEGQLVPDASAGSAILVGGNTTRIRWPSGYSGRRNGAEVEILDQGGRVVARTGTRVRLTGGEMEPRIWLACPDPITL
jgi:hypothetical protein